MGYPLTRNGPLPASGFTYGLSDIMRRLGKDGHDQRWQIRYAQQLVDQAGFPPPLPLLAGETLTEAVKARSRWLQVPVDLWFDDRQGPDATAAVDRQAARIGAEIMDQRAATIGLRMVEGGRA